MQGRNTKTCWKYGIDMSANRKWLSELFCGCLMPVIDLFRFDLHHSIVCVFAARNSSNIASSSGERNTLWVAGKSVQKTGIAVVLFCDGNVFSISFLNAATAQSWYDLRVTATSGNCATEATSGYRARRSRTANRRLLYFKMNGLSKESASLLEVGEEAVGQRIDNFLLKLAKGVPKSHIYRILRSGEVRVKKKGSMPTTALPKAIWSGYRRSALQQGPRRPLRRREISTSCSRMRRCWSSTSRAGLRFMAAAGSASASSNSCVAPARRLACLNWLTASTAKHRDC